MSLLEKLYLLLLISFSAIVCIVDTLLPFSFAINALYILVVFCSAFLLTNKKNFYFVLFACTIFIIIAFITSPSSKTRFWQSLTDRSAAIFIILFGGILFHRYANNKREEDNRFRLVVEAAPNAMIMIDKSRNLVLVNTQAEILFGYSRKEMLGKPLEILIPERFHSKHPKHVSHFFKSPSIRSMGAGRDLFGLRKDGLEVPIEIGLNPIHSSSGFFVLASIIDITERKKIERMKNEFVSTVSHELRTPLTSIRGSLGLISGGAAGELSQKAKPLIQIALTNCDRLVRLINDILDLEKIEAGTIDFIMKESDLQDLIKNCVKLNEAYAIPFDVKLRIVDYPEPILVNIDTDRITQIITNLISNAVKFSNRGGEVIIQAKIDNQKARVSVTDNGKGIPEEFKSKIFGKFAQADSSDTRQKGGTGLGLNICKAIIERHGGSIGFSSVINQGSSFYFDLPLAHVHPQNIFINTDSSLPKFLVCEHNSDLATVLRIILEKDGFRVDIAKNAQSAKKMLNSKNYVGMTLDIMLPDQNGLSLLAELRHHENTKQLPVIIVSAKQINSESKLEAIQNLNISEWITKPIDNEKLKQSAELILQSMPKSDLPILYIEDDRDIAFVVKNILKDIAEVEIAHSCQEARKRLIHNVYSVIILDLNLEDGSGLSLLTLIAEKCPQAKVIIFSAIDTSLSYADHVAAVLLKSNTSNEILRGTVKQMLMKPDQHSNQSSHLS